MWSKLTKAKLILAALLIIFKRVSADDQYYVSEPYNEEDFDNALHANTPKKESSNVTLAIEQDEKLNVTDVADKRQNKLETAKEQFGKVRSLMHFGGEPNPEEEHSPLETKEPKKHKLPSKEKPKKDKQKKHIAKRQAHPKVESHKKLKHPPHANPKKHPKPKKQKKQPKPKKQPKQQKKATKKSKGKGRKK